MQQGEDEEEPMLNVTSSPTEKTEKKKSKREKEKKEKKSKKQKSSATDDAEPPVTHVMGESERVSVGCRRRQMTVRRQMMMRRQRTIRDPMTLPLSKTSEFVRRRKKH